MYMYMYMYAYIFLQVISSLIVHLLWFAVITLQFGTNIVAKLIVYLSALCNITFCTLGVYI